LGSHDAQPANQTANAQVNQHRLVPIARAHPEGREYTADEDDAPIRQDARLHDEALHLLDVRDGARGRDVQGNHDAPEDAQEAADDAHGAQALLEEDGRQHGADDDAQGAQRGDEDGIGEGVCDEVADLADDHERHAAPPPGVLEVAVALAGDLVVLLVRLQQAHLREDEGDADEEARGDGEHDADRLVYGGALCGGAATCADVEVVCLLEELRRGHDGEEGRKAPGAGVGLLAGDLNHGILCGKSKCSRESLDDHRVVS